MVKKYSEEELAWSCIENKIPYAKVVWTMCKNGISRYTFLNKNDKKIDINDYL